MRFEKWQALGNDYAIVEQDELPFELTPERVRVICAQHTGVGADGILLLSESGDPAFVADLRIFNPDGSEAELSGNGVRQAVMYIRRRGWTDNDSFSLATAAGEVRPRITGVNTCSVDMGRARLRSEPDYPSGGHDGQGTLDAAGREFRFQFVQWGTRSARSRRGTSWPSSTCPGTGRRSRATSCSRTGPTSPSGAATPTTRSQRGSSN